MTKPKHKRFALDDAGRIVLTPELTEAVVRLAWQPEGRQLLREALAAEHDAPDQAGLQRAIDGVRLVVHKPPRKKDGRPASREKTMLTVWLLFNAALGRKRLVEPGFTKKAMMDEFVERSIAGKGFWHDGRRAAGHEGSKRLPSGAARLTSPAQLEKMLKLAEKKLKGRVGETLRHYLPADIYTALHSTEE